MELFAAAIAVILTMGYCSANCDVPAPWRRQPAIRRDDGPDIFSYHNRCFYASSAYPCSCGGDSAFLLLTCDKIESLDDMRRVFLRRATRNNFGKFSLTNSKINVLPGDLFGDVTFEYIYVKKNPITVIKRGIFGRMSYSLKRIEIIHNDVSEFPFDEMSGLLRLEHFDLYYNDITKIPDSAFGYCPSLKKINLSFNKIVYIGTNAFVNLPALVELDMRYNNFKVLNNKAFALHKVNTGLILDISNNKLQYSPDDAFANQSPKVFNISNNNLAKFSENLMLPILEGMVQRNGGYIIAAGNRFRCTCKDIGWLVRRSHTYIRHVEDFWCVNIKKELSELTLSDMGCS